MTAEQIESRQARVQKGVLVASRVDDGYRVYSTEDPSQQYAVRWDGERLTCTCPDFAFHKADPDWHCKHPWSREAIRTSVPIALAPVHRHHGPRGGHKRRHCCD